MRAKLVHYIHYFISMTFNLTTYTEDGFFGIQNVIDENERNQVKRANRESSVNPSKDIGVLYEENNPSNPIRSVMGHHGHPILEQLVRHPLLLSIAESIVGSQVYVSQFLINTKAPLRDGKTQGKRWIPHRGYSFWKTFDGYQNPEKTTTAFVNLSEQTIENGALYFFRGSHRLSIEELEQETEYTKEDDPKAHGSEYLSLQIKESFLERYRNEFERVDLIGNAGDIWFSHPLALHASEENNSTESRDIAVIRYNAIDNIPTHPRKESYWCSRNYAALQPRESKA